MDSPWELPRTHVHASQAARLPVSHITLARCLSLPGPGPHHVRALPTPRESEEEGDKLSFCISEYVTTQDH